VREGEERAELSAEFDLDPHSALAGWLREHALEGDAGSILLRRTVDRGGRSRAFINGHAATLAQLREAGESLVDIHGQHAHQSLLRAASQRMAQTAVSYTSSPGLAPAYGDVRVLGLHAFVSDIPLGPEFTAQVRLADGRLAWDVVYLDADFDREAAAALAGLLDGDDPPSALVSSGHGPTAGALQVLVERRLRDSVAHVALDDLGCGTLLDPPLTVVRYDVSRLGAVVADLLFERVGGRAGRARRVVLRPSLVERGSGELRPPRRR